jgi:hypothetical protein
MKWKNHRDSLRYGSSEFDLICLYSESLLIESWRTLSVNTLCRIASRCHILKTPIGIGNPVNGYHSELVLSNQQMKNRDINTSHLRRFTSPDRTDPFTTFSDSALCIGQIATFPRCAISINSFVRPPPSNCYSRFPISQYPRPGFPAVRFKKCPHVVLGEAPARL